MNSVEEKALRTYRENINYFKDKHPKLFEKITALETAINAGYYTEKYALEYTPQDYFDIVEIQSGAYFYNQNSYDYATSIVEKTDTSRFNGVFEGQRLVEFSPEMPDIIDKSTLHFHNALWATAKIIEYSKKVVPKKSTFMNNVYKLLFIGAGLGLHIEGIRKKVGGKVLFIKENNLEIFRLSLFVTSYHKIAQSAELYFSVMETEEYAKASFIDFMERGNNYNLYLKYFPLTQNDEQEITQFQVYVLNQSHITYPYSAYLLRYIDAPRYIPQGYTFLNLAVKQENTLLEDKPLLMLFSGPSTFKNIEWIARYQEQFIIVTALSTCRLLYKHGITPHIVMHIDPQGPASMKLFEGIEPAFFEDVITLLAGNVHQDVVAQFKKEQIYFIQQDGDYKAGFRSFSSPTVGEFTYAMMLFFGSKELYLLGVDLALDPDTLASHADGYHPFAETATQELDLKKGGLEKSLLHVKGNFLSQVPTYPGYLNSINEFGRFSDMLLTPEHKVFNLSNGAYLKGAEPLHVEEVRLDRPNNPRSTTIQSLHAMLSAIGDNQFRQVDKESFLYQLNEAKKLLKKIKAHKAMQYRIAKVYLDALSRLSWELSDMEKKTNADLAEVFYYYFKVVLSYIFDLFNTKNLEYPHKHIQAIDAILVAQLEKMAGVYISRLEEVMNV